jgi:hypothetical protein
VLALMVGAIFLPIEISDLWRWGAEMAGHPLAVIGIVVIMALLMSFGQPGGAGSGLWDAAATHSTGCVARAGRLGKALVLQPVEKRQPTAQLT